MGPLDNISGATPVLPFPVREVRVGRMEPALPANALSETASGGGRFAQMSREELRPLLSSYFQQYWNAPDALAALVGRALREGWASQSLEAVQQLARIDPQPERAARLLATALIDLGRFTDAEPILTVALQPRQPPLPSPERAVLLTLLARAQLGHGDAKAAERTLWQALEADPNAEDALQLYAALARTRGGTAGELDAYEQTAKLPGSWRAELWLARNALQTPASGLPVALAYYQKILQQTDPPPPPEALMRVSADLAGRGLLKESVDLVAPRYEPARHGLPLGETLLRGFLDLRDAPGARQLLNSLLGQHRPEWRDRLRAWEGEIAKPYPDQRPIPGDRPTPGTTMPPPLKPTGNDFPAQVAKPTAPGIPPPAAAASTPPALIGKPAPVVSRDVLPPGAPGEAPPPGSSPEELVAYIVRTLRAGRAGECLPGARHLASIDPQPQRAAQLLATTLLRLSCFPEAEQVLARALLQPGADQAQLLTYLARARVGVGDTAGAELKLWQALQADPNLEEALHSFAASHRERLGPAGAVDAYRRAAELPGSWRASLWLAQNALQEPAADVPAAISLFQKILLRTPPAPAEALAQLGTEVNSRGLMKELVAASVPRFEPAEHGLPAGSTLLRGALDLGDTAAAQRLLQLLYAQQRPEWRETLQFWQRALDKQNHAHRRQAGAGAGFEIVDDYDEMQILSLEGPIWARAGSNDPFADLVPAKLGDAIRVAFFCGSLAMPPALPAEEMSPAAAPLPVAALGRFTRGLPLFLAERVHLQTDASASTLVPRSKRGGGFVLSSNPWTASALAVMLAMEESRRPDYVVLFHLVTSREPTWQAQFQLACVRQQTTIARWEETLEPDNLAATVDSLVARVLRQLGETIPKLSLRPAPAGMLPATVGQVPAYLSELEQELASWCGVGGRKK